MQSYSSAINAGIRAALAHLSSLANPDHLLIVCTLSDTECSIEHLVQMLGISLSKLLEQLGELSEARLLAVRYTNEGKLYRIADARLVALVPTLKQIFFNPPPSLGRQRT